MYGIHVTCQFWVVKVCFVLGLMGDFCFQFRVLVRSCLLVIVIMLAIGQIVQLCVPMLYVRKTKKIPVILLLKWWSVASFVGNYSVTSDCDWCNTQLDNILNCKFSTGLFLRQVKPSNMVKADPGSHTVYLLS